MVTSVTPGVLARCFLAATLITATLGSVGVVHANDPAADSATTHPQYVADRPSEVSSQQPENDSVPHHKNPREISQPGRLGMLSGWLSGNMGEILIDCSTGLRVGTYDLCKRLDGDYPEWLSRYVDLADETDTEDDNRASTGFRRAREDQQRFVRQVREFRETLAAFERARRNGEEARAQRLARKLVQLGDEINATGRTLLRDYQLIENTTDVTLQPAKRSVRTITANLTAISATIADEQFTSATLTVHLETQRISFLRPLSLSGRVTAANGTPLADRTIVLDIGGRERRTRTNESGGFTLTYRPVTVPLATESVTVRFVPANTSVYRGASTTRPITITQVDGTITLSTTPAVAVFNDSVTVTGTVTVGDREVTGIPVRVTFAGKPVGTPQTTAAGRFTTTTTIPAAVPPGAQPVRGMLPFEDRAVTAPAATTGLTIEQTDTRLSVQAEQVDGRQLDVRGRLATVNGTPLSGQAVTLRLDNRTLTTVETGPDGQYTATIRVPAERRASGGENMTVVVTSRFDGDGTNLDTATARTVVTVQLPDQPSIVERIVSGAVAIVAGTAGAIAQAIAGAGGAIVGALATAGGAIVEAIPEPGETIVRALAGTAGAIAQALADATNGLRWWQWLTLLAIVVIGTRVLQSLGVLTRITATAQDAGAYLSRVTERFPRVTGRFHDRLPSVEPHIEVFTPITTTARNAKMHLSRLGKIARDRLPSIGPRIKVVTQIAPTIRNTGGYLSHATRVLYGRFSVYVPSRSIPYRLTYAIRQWVGAFLWSVLSFPYRVYGALYARWTPAPDTSDPHSEPAPDRSETSGQQGDDTSHDPLQPARDSLAAGNPGQAITAAYATVRANLQQDITDGSNMTHREFLAACQANEFSTDRIEVLESVTEAYEEVAFAPHSPDIEAAERTVSDAATLM